MDVVFVLLNKLIGLIGVTGRAFSGLPPVTQVVTCVFLILGLPSVGGLFIVLRGQSIEIQLTQQQRETAAAREEREAVHAKRQYAALAGKACESALGPLGPRRCCCMLYGLTIQHSLAPNMCITFVTGLNFDRPLLDNYTVRAQLSFSTA